LNLPEQARYPAMENQLGFRALLNGAYQYLHRNALETGKLAHTQMTPNINKTRGWVDPPNFWQAFVYVLIFFDIFF
jgi:hypothetical protein